MGTNVYPLMFGRVMRIGEDPVPGKWIKIMYDVNNNGVYDFYSYYMHLEVESQVVV